MNTNQIPPGIIAMVCHTGHVVRQFGNNYAEWYNKYKDEYTIHTISVDGTQWSVGDKCATGTYENVIEKFQYNRDKWFAHFQNGDFQQVDLLTTPTVKDSGGEEGEENSVGRGNYRPTPSSSEPEERKWSDKDIENCFMEAREIAWDWKNHPISFNEWFDKYKSKTSNP